MARLKRDELEEIVERDMPGYRLARKQRAPEAMDPKRELSADAKRCRA